MHIKDNNKLYTSSRFPWEKSSGLVIGRTTSPHNAFFAYSRPATSSNMIPISSGRTTAETKACSYLSLAKLCIKLLIQHEKKICRLSMDFHIILTKRKLR